MLSSVISRSARRPISSTRFFSAESAPARGASLFQRLSSFAVGAGLTALGTQYFIYEDIRYGNQLMLDKQKQLEKRLDKLEKK